MKFFTRPLCPLTWLKLSILCAVVWASPVIAHPQPVDYFTEIKPIFEQKCVACHACYDAPCQLKLTSNEGLVRGASKMPVYDGARTKDAPPSRLHFDAHSEAQWRDKDFFSVLDAPTNQASLMLRMLALGQETNWSNNQRLPEDLDLTLTRNNQCSQLDEFDTFAKQHPNAGMPFAVNGLTSQEYQLVQRWLSQGAKVPTQTVTLSPMLEWAQIRWESWLNRDAARQQLVARYLYEHWFLGHLYFSDLGESAQHTFFEVVRSRTPTGQPIDVIATERPSDDPQAKFYYRLRPRVDTRVHKTHITYALNSDKMAHLEQLFFADDWIVKDLPDYRQDYAANPFFTYAAIPAGARYQFLLDDAEYFVRSFIRGPVCRGQIATDVIRDQFWVSFQAPEHDLFITDASHQSKVRDWLTLPGLNSDLLSLGPDWISYSRGRNNYLKFRQQAYAKQYPLGPNLEHVWDGDQHNRQALLTVFRHHDSASVVRGWQGDTPTTMWVMDYPLLERTYYALVANFNVYGSVSHQAKTRLYFDLIRNGAEANFLRFLPSTQRNDLLHAWYDNSGRIKLFTSYADVDETTPSRIKIDAKQPLADFSQQIFRQLAPVAGSPDLLNRCRQQDCNAIGGELERPLLTGESNQARIDDQLRRLTGVSARLLPVIKWLPEVTLLRIEDDHSQERHVYTLLHNRDHSNVAFMLGENLRLRPHNDTLSVLPGIISSYPNFIFNVKQSELADFISALTSMTDEQEIHKVADRYGIRRTHPNFWFYFHDMHTFMQETAPIEAGILDMNRYENL
ncbi:fatty acid cis/trans isomerase [Oceanisphaera avium]|uniref:Peptidylprolyl isomerase n=1 Tax=Oceanisphaera avium TaxID=1903694 RepID=A0A1Y0CUT2_9GAMM|nr:fatty acid cis/trans isomerase [Oceanisphaera avium]ART79042.1 peptidylprolyl isomerase [Oceanisphaera avium]